VTYSLVHRLLTSIGDRYAAQRHHDYREDAGMRLSSVLMLNFASNVQQHAITQSLSNYDRLISQRASIPQCACQAGTRLKLKVHPNRIHAQSYRSGSFFREASC
jgi:hypothetical protein